MDRLGQSKPRSPTVGAYDKLAIRYGYTHLQTPADPSLAEILEEPRAQTPCLDPEKPLRGSFKGDIGPCMG